MNYEKYNGSDEELVKKYLKGDSRAFTPLFKKYKPISILSTSFIRLNDFSSTSK